MPIFQTWIYCLIVRPGTLAYFAARRRPTGRLRARLVPRDKDGRDALAGRSGPPAGTLLDEKRPQLDGPINPLLWTPSAGLKPNPFGVRIILLFFRPPTLRWASPLRTMMPRLRSFL